MWQIRPIRESLRQPSLVLLFISMIAAMGGVVRAPLCLGGDVDAAPDPMLAYLLEQTERRPDHADSWRLLARHYRQIHRYEEARDALDRSLAIDEHSLACFFEAGELALCEGDIARADQHFLKLLQYGAESDYAEKLRTNHPAAAARLTGIAAAIFTPTSADAEADDLLPVAYEIQTFDGADDAEAEFRRRSEEVSSPLSRLHFFLETGILYNSNVSLTPTSRELRNPNQEAGGFQLFANPDLQWDAIKRDFWRMGPTARGYGTINESRLSEFNLSSYQPGFFIEKESVLWGTDLIRRADYSYTIDLLDQERFADRHSITLALTAIRPSGHFLYSYWTSSFSQFEDDGIDPSVDSLDGVSHSAGLTQFIQINRRWLQVVNVGIDGEMAETEGADFRYDALNFHSGATCPLGLKWTFLPEAGVGYRSYGDFTGTPSRNELTWRVGGRLRWDWTETASISLVARHDRFASENDQFDAERTEGGVVLTLTR